MSLFSHIAFYFKRMRAYSVTVDNYGNPYGMQDIKVDFMSNINYAMGPHGQREQFICSGDSSNMYTLVVHAKTKEEAQNIAINRIRELSRERVAEENRELRERLEVLNTLRSTTLMRHPDGYIIPTVDAYSEVSPPPVPGQIVYVRNMGYYIFSGDSWEMATLTFTIQPKLKVDSIEFTFGVVLPASLERRDIVVRKGIVNE